MTSIFGESSCSSRCLKLFYYDTVRSKDRCELLLEYLMTSFVWHPLLASDRIVVAHQ